MLARSKVYLSQMHDCMAAGMCNMTDFHSAESVPAKILCNDVSLSEELAEWRHNNPEYWDKIDQLLLEEYGICTLSLVTATCLPKQQKHHHRQQQEQEQHHGICSVPSTTNIAAAESVKQPPQQAQYPRVHDGEERLAEAPSHALFLRQEHEVLSNAAASQVLAHHNGLDPDEVLGVGHVSTESMASRAYEAFAENNSKANAASSLAVPAPTTSCISTFAVIKQSNRKSSKPIKVIPMQTQAPKPAVKPASHSAARSSGGPKRSAINHNSLERQRREELRSGYQTLLKSIPEEEVALIEHLHNVKYGIAKMPKSPSKVQILNYAREYCLKLQQLSFRQEKDKERLVAKQQLLKKKLTRVTNATSSCSLWKK